MDAPNNQSSFVKEQYCTDGACSNEQEVARNKYHRHTLDQVQELENFFKEYPWPDKKQIVALSMRLGLEIRQVQFWFQNKRTQLKTQSERHENGLLKQQLERLRAENEHLKYVYANSLCGICGGTIECASLSSEHERLRTENARLKRELQHLYSVTDKLFNESVSS